MQTILAFFVFQILLSLLAIIFPATPHGLTMPENDTNIDTNIMSTAEDAIQAKEATVNAGYYSDAFLEPFCNNSPVRRRRQIQPIIKRGTHARVCCMDRAISSFCNITATSNRRQIVVIGAGKDTSYFRYCTGSIMGMVVVDGTPPPCDWYEVDHSSVIQEKSRIINDSELLSSHCFLEKNQYGFFTSRQDQTIRYNLLEHDLRDSPEDLIEKLQLDTDIPTLFLMECVLMYVPISSSNILMKSLSKSAKETWIICYEPILLASPFGRMMQQNLQKAGVATPDSCLLQVRTLQGQLQKLIDGGFCRAVGCDLWSAYQTILTQRQRQHANQCEFLDEIEEWMMIMKHYCFFAATTSKLENDEIGLTGVGGNSLLGFVSNQCQVLNSD